MRNTHRSAIYSPRRAIDIYRRIAHRIREDQLTVYAAQASFFLILSAIPLLMLLWNVSTLLSPKAADILVTLMKEAVPTEFHAALASLIDQLRITPTMPLLSVTAIAALYSASRGIAALERGLRFVYGLETSQGYLRDAIRSLLLTAIFMVLMPATLLVLVFGAQLGEVIMSAFPGTEGIITHIMDGRGWTAFFGLTTLFSIEHYSVQRGGRCLFGAAASAAGWMLFSGGYSLYLRYFSRTAHMYGRLAMPAILMLWVYICMCIFLAGAEVNKYMQARKR